MGRIRTGAVRPEPVSMALIDLVQSVTARRGRGSTTDAMTLDFDPDLPAVDVDVLLMDHVLTNLVENAALHGATDAPDRDPWLRPRRHGPGSRSSTTAPACPPADRERIFDEFVRRHAPTDGGGTGLGLTIVRALVDAQGGRVWCEETPGGGATFVVELPVGNERSTP